MTIFELITRVRRFRIPTVMGYPQGRDNATDLGDDMARREILIDDINGSHDDVQPVTFIVNATTYTLDLGADSRAALMTALQPFLDHAHGARRTRTAGTRKPSKRNSAPSEVAALRHWARENGYPVGDRGRIPQNVLDAYAAR